MDVILAVGDAAIRAARDATKTTPIVMGFGSDPVQRGFVASLARPGGNVTGVAYSPDDANLVPKRLELLKETIPLAERIAVLATGEESAQLQAAQKAALTLGAKLVTVEVRENNYERAFATLGTERASALLVLANPILYPRPGEDHRARREASPARDVRVARARRGGRPNGVWQ